MSLRSAAANLGSLPNCALQSLQQRSCCVQIPDVSGYEPGQALDVENLFKVGDLVDVAGQSIGKGFQGNAVQSSVRLCAVSGTRCMPEVQQHPASTHMQQQPLRWSELKELQPPTAHWAAYVIVYCCLSPVVQGLSRALTQACKTMYS